MRMPARSHLLALLALVFALGTTRAAYADDPRAEAKAHYQSGVKLYGSGDYQGAIREFTAAQAIAPADLNNYNLALCYDKLGDAPNGIKFYRAYLDRVPNADKRAEIEASIERLKASVRAPDPVPVPAPAPSAPVAPAPPPVAPAPPAPVAPAPPPIASGATGAPSTGAPAVTGDAQLDRIQGVDIGSMRDQRMGAGPQGGPPPPRDINSVGQPGAPPPNGNLPPAGVGTAPTSQPAPGTQADIKPQDPIYKKWWFWAVVGVSAYVVYSIATEKSTDGGVAKTGRVDGALSTGKSLSNRASNGGFTLFSW